jgi:hypothetical protein
MEYIYKIILKNLKVNIPIFIIGLVFSGCIGKSPVPYSKEQILKNESLIVFSATRDKYIKDLMGKKDIKMSFNDSVDLAIENIDTKEVYKFGMFPFLANKICHAKPGLFFDAKLNLIDTENICGNVYIARLPFGNYRINTIYIGTFNLYNQLQQKLEYQITNDNTFTLKSDNETLYLGNIHYKPLIASRHGYLYSLDFTIADNFDKDIEILKGKDLVNKDFIFIDKSLNIPTTLIKRKSFWE